MPLVRAVGKKQMSSFAKRAAHISDFNAMVGRFGLPSDVITVSQRSAACPKGHRENCSP